MLEAVGKNVTRWKTGDRVTLPFVCGCGHCLQCLSGNHQVCDFQFQPGFTHWGSFAEYVAVDYADTNLVPLPASISDVAAAALGTVIPGYEPPTGSLSTTAALAITAIGLGSLPRRRGAGLISRP